MMKRSRRPFTLLEMMLCIALLSMVAGLVGWQMRGLFRSHSFQKSVDNLFTDVRQLQIIALSDRADITLIITQKDGIYSYVAHTDEPTAKPSKQTTTLKGVEKIAWEPEDQELTLTIYSTGRIAPAKKLCLWSSTKKQTGLYLDLENTPSLLCKGLDKDCISKKEEL